MILFSALAVHFSMFEKFENKNNNLLKANLIDYFRISESIKPSDKSSESKILKVLKDQSFESYKNTADYFKPEPKEKLEEKPKKKISVNKEDIQIKQEDKDNPVLSAHSILLRNLTSGDILMKKNESDSWPMASLTKLMMASIAFENIDLNSKILITKASTNQPSNSLLKAGEYYSASDMIKISLINSNNASAFALAESFGYEKFMSLMQAKANMLGMKNSAFYDPTGISSLNKSTALDFEILGKYLYENHKDILDITAEKNGEITEITSGIKKSFTSTNIFAGKDYFIGGKTGYTLEAQGNLFSIFQAGNKVILSIVLGSKSRFEDTQKIYILTLRKLLGFSMIKN